MFLFCFCLVSLDGDQSNNVSLFSPRHYTVDPMLLPSGNPFKSREEVLYLQAMIPPKRFDIYPPDWGMLRMSRYVRFFLNASRPSER